MATAAKFVLPIPIFLAYLVPLDVDVTGYFTAKIYEVWSEFNIFAPWLPWQRPPFRAHPLSLRHNLHKSYFPLQLSLLYFILQRKLIH
jgi:hypothetical protein